jgi:hypothetical protein
MSSAGKVVGVTTTLVVLITLFVCIRAYVRCVLFRSVKWDDGMFFLGGVGFIVLTGASARVSQLCMFPRICEHETSLMMVGLGYYVM